MTYNEILEAITTAAHGEISTEALQAAAFEIWESNNFETAADLEAYTETWEIVAKHDAA